MSDPATPTARRNIRSMACRMFARNARRNPSRALRWELMIERYAA